MGEDGDALVSPTLAELYYKQADLGKAILILIEFLVRRPEEHAVRSRLKEMEEEFLQKTDAGRRNRIVSRLNEILELVRKERVG